MFSSVIVGSLVGVEFATKPHQDCDDHRGDKWPACTRLLAVAPAGHIPPLLHHSSGHDPRDIGAGEVREGREALVVVVEDGVSLSELYFG